MPLEPELKAVKYAVSKAAEAIMRIAGESYKTARQADRTVLTAADLESDRILKDVLLGEFSDYGWLSEETVDDRSRLEADRVWIVDPMDGTREFVMHNPEFVVSVALVEHGHPVLGVIYNPSTNDCYEAVTRCGTRLNGRPVFSDHVLDGRLKVEVSRSDIEKGLFAAFDGLVDLRPCGSIAYKMARLAAGKADATLSVTPKSEWDIAAGVILITEAGGRVTDLSGKPYLFNQQNTRVNGVVAASSHAYDRIRSIVDDVSAQ
jgi:myo-inositol-1(or 4)-monophosphatase